MATKFVTTRNKICTVTHEARVKGNAVSRKSEGGEGGVTNAPLKKHKSNSTLIKAEQKDLR